MLLTLLPPYPSFLLSPAPCFPHLVPPSLSAWPVAAPGWRVARCSPGFAVTENGKNCTDADECLTEPCLNGGTCMNRPHGEGFYCLCPDGFGGDLCGALRQEKIMRLSMAALAAILVCLLNILSECPLPPSPTCAWGLSMAWGKTGYVALTHWLLLVAPVQGLTVAGGLTEYA